VFTASQRADDSALLAFYDHEPVGWVDPQRYGRGLAAGTYRREWTWLALLDGRPVARGVWWGPVGAVHPVELHCLLVEPSIPHPEVWGGALIRSAHRAFAAAGAILAPDVVVEFDAARRGEPRLETALEWRRLSAESAGLPVVTERPGGVTYSARPLVVRRPAEPVPTA
jgi:hypothetical protein